MQRIFPWLTAMLALACLVLIYLWVRAEAEIRQAQVDWTARDAGYARRVAALESELAATQSDLSRARKRGAGFKAVSGADAAGGGNGEARIVHLSQIFKEHPGFEELYARIMRRDVLRSYGAELSRLHLTPEQLEKLKSLLVDRQLGTLDAQQAAEAEGLPRGSAGYAAAIRAAGQSVDQEIAALLGPDGNRTLQGIQARAAVSNQVQTDYGPQFAQAGLALSPEQSQGLVQAIADASYSGKDLTQRPADYNTPDPVTGLTPHETRILDAAAQVLTPAQFLLFKEARTDSAQESAVIRQYTQGAGSVMIVP